MRKRRFLPIVSGAACAVLLMAGCAFKARKAGGRTDDPPAHCKQGMKYWDDGNYAQAEEEFNLAQSLDSNYAPAYAGLALTTAQAAKTAGNAETAEKGFQEALKLADKAQRLDNKISDVFIAKAIVITMKNEGKEAKTWLDEVEKEYHKALKLDKKNAEAFYRRGCCYKKAYEFSKAADDLKKVIALKKKFTTQAKEQLEIVQKIERATSGTDVSKKIALVEQVSRADIAALFVSELQIDKLMDEKTAKNHDTVFQKLSDSMEMKADSMVSTAEVTDIEGHWAENFIMDIVERGIRGLEPYPDHTFCPDQPVSRGEFALMIEDVLIAITGGKDPATKQIDTVSRFPDVDTSHHAYDAICIAVDKGVMDAAKNGEFGLDRPLSGPDALLAIRNLKFLWLH
ncbi:MAG: S-layer homology domain-containing protein [Chitinispirillaceae bacterium]|nr:S-layer homology domain-containing protein [Chitinispirillaceae bacterium]